MTKYIISAIVAIVLFGVSFFLSRHPQPMRGIDNNGRLHMGYGTYNEPFVGILKSKPKFLVWTLSKPPFKYFADDTIRLSRTFTIEFNEESIRFFEQTGKKTVITFKPESNKVKFYPSRIEVEADRPTKQITTHYTIDPSAGMTTENIIMEIQSNGIDMVNENAVNSNGYAIAANCFVLQYIGRPFVIWYLWLLIPILIIFGLYKLATWAFSKDKEDTNEQKQTEH